MIDDLLLNSNIQRPARYIGKEWNVSSKSFDDARVRFALCFPDLYEVGMSNLGIRIIYGLLNGMEGVACERFFSLAADMESALASAGKKPPSLESGRSLAEFDIVGFSLGYELCYTNVLAMLECAGIPLHSAERASCHPLVIAGGPCALNPEPMHAFFDAFLIGEAEEALPEIVAAYASLKQELSAGRLSRQDALERLAAIEGVYVPSLYEPQYLPGGKIARLSALRPNLPERIKKRTVSNLDESFFPQDWLVPYLQTVHDRITLEIARGCPNRCRFCQARQHYYPLRQRSPQSVLRLAEELYKRTGYEEIALAGLSVSDYPCIEELMSSLVGMFRRRGVGVSLPSIKPKDLVGGLSKQIASIRKTGLTFAPEAATPALRSVLDKDFNLEEFFGALQQAFRSGYQRVKLYFMINLPGEQKEDLDAILDFAASVSNARRKVSGGPAEVNVSINALIPKAHTPFQWLAMQGIEETEEKQLYLKRKLKNKRIKLNFHDARMSFMEGVLCRGDRRLSKVIEAAFKKGCRFDAWQDQFRFDLWMEAFSECGTDPQVYLGAKDKQEILPWGHVDIGISREALLQESP